MTLPCFGSLCHPQRGGAILPGHGETSVGDKEDAPAEEGKTIQQEEADVERDVKAEVVEGPGARAREVTGAEASEADLAEN